MAQSEPLLALLSFAVLISKVFSNEFQNETEHEKRITNGITTDIRDAKFYAYLDCANRQAWCGATLVTDDKLITAAHCMLDCPGSQYVKIYVGMNSMQDYYNRKVKSYDVARIVIHPNYRHDKHNFFCDIAVVHLKTKIERNEVVQPISYATSPVPLGKQVVCYGYGPTNSNQNSADRLQRTTFTTKYYDTNVLMVDASRSTILPGDSGGPCIYNNQLAAEIVSYGYPTPVNGLVVTGNPEILSFLRSQGL